MQTLTTNINSRSEEFLANRTDMLDMLAEMERLLEEASFKGGDMDSPLVIDSDYVNAQLGELAVDEDLSRYIL